MLPIKNDVRTRSLQDHSDQLCQLSIAKHACLWKLSNIKLIENLARCRERLNKHSFLVAHVRRHKMQILQRQRQIFRECAVMRHNAQHRTPRTVRLHPTLAKIAHRPKSVSAQDTLISPATRLPTHRFSLFAETPATSATSPTNSCPSVPRNPW